MATILLVEDHELVRGTIRRALEFAGYSVIDAIDGSDAEAILETTLIHLMVSDLIMPVREGLDLIRSVRESHPGLPIIAMSGGGRSRAFELLDVAKQFGADVILRKPFKRSVLIESVQQLLSDRGMKQSAPITRNEQEDE